MANTRMVLPVALATFSLLAGVQCRADQVDDLIAKLGNSDFGVRQQAELDLVGLLNMMSGAQLKRLVEATGDNDLERATRAKSTLQQWSKKFAPVRDMMAKIESVNITASTDDEFPGIVFSTVRFDGINGSFNTTNTAQVELWGGIQSRFARVEDAVRGANLNDADAALEALHTYVNDADGGELNFLFGADAKTRLLNKLNDADSDLLDAKLALKGGSNNSNPAPNKRGQVMLPGPVDLGLTVKLAVAGVVTPGEVGLCAMDSEWRMAPPPAGYQFVGELWRLFAADALKVAGQVDVTIEFGAAQLIGTAVADPNGLRMVRIANGVPTILEDYELLPGGTSLRASYFASSGDPGEQFGLFALVQVPSPGGAGILIAGLVIASRRRRD